MRVLKESHYSSLSCFASRSQSAEVATFRQLLLLFLGQHCTKNGNNHLREGFVPLGVNPRAGNNETTVNPRPPVVCVSLAFCKLGIHQLNFTGWHLVFDGQLEFAFRNVVVRSSPAFAVTDTDAVKHLSIAGSNDDIETTTIRQKPVFLTFRFDECVDLSLNDFSCLLCKSTILEHIYFTFCFDLFLDYI